MILGDLSSHGYRNHPTDFRTRFPELATATDGLITNVLEEACLIHSVRKAATLLCAAHLLVLEQRRDRGSHGGGEIQSRGVGGLSASYLPQAESGRESFFTVTDYGRRFLTLEKRAARSRIGSFVAS